MTTMHPFERPGTCRGPARAWEAIGIGDKSLVLVCVATDKDTQEYAICKSVVVREDEETDTGLVPSRSVTLTLDMRRVSTGLETPLRATASSNASNATPSGASPAKFSFKDFSSSIRTSEATASTPAPSQSLLTPSNSTTPSPQIRSLLQQLKSMPLETVKVVGSVDDTLYVHEGRVATASSVSVELEIEEVPITTRKRMQAWFVGLHLCENSIVHGMGGTLLRGRVRRTVPASTFVLCGRDTRVVLECVPPAKKSTLFVDDEKQGKDVEVDYFNFIISRFEFPERYVGFEKLSFPKGILLHGPPGTGKSYSVQQLVRRLRLLDVPVSFQAPQPGDFQAAGGAFILSETFARARKFVEANERGVSVIFLDEFDSYAGTRGGHAQNNQSYIGKLLTLIDGIQSKSEVNRAIVFGATNHVDAIDIAMRRPGRFDREVVFRLPTADERYEYVMGMLSYQIPNRTDIAEFFRNKCIGYSFADIVAHLRRYQDKWDELATGDAKIASALRSNNVLQQSDDRIAIIGGQEEAKRALTMAIEWPITRKQDLARFEMAALFRGVLLYGPPGCAKTTLVRSIAKATRGKASFYSLSGADVFSSGYGDAEAAVRRVFRQARATAPSILFFDEVDSLVGSRDEKSSSSGGSDSVQNRVLSTFLNEMDGVDTLTTDAVVVVGATNCPENIDKALMRPGRFDKLVFVGPPDPLSVLQIEVAAMNLSNQIDCHALVHHAYHMSGADVAGACRLAALAALARGSSESPNQNDFEESLRRGTRSCAPSVLERYHRFHSSN